ncbi:MAG TPA: hypothetical protein VGN00_10780 [Puia sp.]
MKKPVKEKSSARIQRFAQLKWVGKYEGLKWIGTLFVFFTWVIQNKFVPDIKSKISQREYIVNQLQTNDLLKNVIDLHANMASELFQKDSFYTNCYRGDMLFAAANSAIINFHLSALATLHNLSNDSGAVIQQTMKPLYDSIVQWRQINDTDRLKSVITKLNIIAAENGSGDKFEAAHLISIEKGKINPYNICFYIFGTLGPFLIFFQFWLGKKYPFSDRSISK